MSVKVYIVYLNYDRIRCPCVYLSVHTLYMYVCNCMWQHLLVYSTDCSKCCLTSRNVVYSLRLFILSSSGSLYLHVSMRQLSTSHLLMLDGDKNQTHSFAPRPAVKQSSQLMLNIWAERQDRGIDRCRTVFDTCQTVFDTCSIKM